MLQKYRNQMLEGEKPLSMQRKERLNMIQNSQVKISHDADSYYTMGKIAQLGETRRRNYGGIRSESFSETRHEKAWNAYYSSLNGSELAVHCYRQADTPLRKETTLLETPKKGVNLRVEGLKSSFQIAPRIKDFQMGKPDEYKSHRFGEEQSIPGSKSNNQATMAARAKYVYTSSVFI